MDNLQSKRSQPCVSWYANIADALDNLNRAKEHQVRLSYVPLVLFWELSWCLVSASTQQSQWVAMQIRAANCLRRWSPVKDKR